MNAPLLARVVGLLAAADIPAALIGAAAMAVHGVSRSTLDQDLLVAELRALDDRLWTPLAGSARVDIRRGNADDPLAGVVRISADAERDVDVVVGRHSWQREIVEEASPVATAGGVIRVVSPGGLVLLKLYAGGSQDFWDIDQLRDIIGPALDDAVERRLENLPASMSEAWRRVCSTR